MVKIVTSNFLKDAVIKSILEEYHVKSQELSEDELTFGTEVIDPPYSPFMLDRLREISGLHDICIRVKCEDTVFSGKNILCDGEAPFEVEEFFEDFSFDEELESFLEDYITFGFAGLEILRDNQGQIKAVNRISSLYLRMCRDKERVLQKIGANENYFKLYNPQDKRRLNRETGRFDDDINSENVANEIIWFNSKSHESKVYGKPDYLSEIDAILTDNAIIEYQQGHFKAHGVPNYIITVTGNVEENDDQNLDEWEAQLEEEFKNISNEPGTALCIVIPSEEDNVKVNVNKIGEEKKEGSFIELSDSVADRIRRIHRVPRERLGDSDSSGIASNRTEALLKNYSSSIATLQRRIANLINKTIIMNEFEDNDVKIEFQGANFEDEDKTLERGIRLLQNGAITLGEFINRFGEPYELKMNPDDEFYNCRFMNNQALQNVVYGDSALDAEGKLNSMISSLDDEIHNRI